MITLEETTIERKTLIHAPRTRVWRSLTNSQEFSKWFGVDLDSSFEPGKRLDMLSRHSCGDGGKFSVRIERMEPEHYFSWRWHPSAANRDEDGTTHVAFHLEEVPDGTLVTVTESGFDGISLERRAKAFGQNSHGWEIQLESLKKHASEAA